MIIGNFTYDKKTDTYRGEVSFLDYVNLQIKPNKKSGDSEPDYRIVAGAMYGVLEIGAGWRRVSEKSGQEFISVRIDHPMLPAPVNAALFLDDAGKKANLVWSRKAKRADETEAPPTPAAENLKKKAA